MATNLLFSVPSIPWQAVVLGDASYDTSVFEEDHPLDNAINGPRYFWKSRTSAVSNKQVRFDLGAGNTETADHFIIARADVLQADAVDTVRLESSDNDFISKDVVVNQTSFDTNTLRGPGGNDYITTFSQPTARRYWRVWYDGSPPTQQRVSKYYFGRAVDIGDPVNIRLNLTFPRSRSFVTSNDSRYPRRGEDKVYAVELQYEGITDAELQDFKNRVASGLNRDGVFLYTTTCHDILFDFRVLHCRVTRVNWNKVENDWNSLTVGLEELLG